MIFLLSFALLWSARLAPAQSTPCVSVEGDRITAADIATVAPEFRSLPADAPLAAAPVPGVRRVFHAGDLLALGKRYGVDIAEPGNICFERPMEPLDPKKALETMRQSLGLPDARIEIVELSRYPIPRGSLEFRREALRSPALPSVATPVEWRGNVVYGANRRYSIWARVIVSARVPRVVTVEKLKRGELIELSQLRLETSEAFPQRGDTAESLDQVAGRTPLFDLNPGAEIRLSQITSPPDIDRGQEVQVEVRSGAARLVLVGKAESAGRTGDSIAIRNLESNRTFRARVSGKGAAVLDTGPVVGN